MSMRCALLQLWALLRWFVLTRGLTGGDAALTTLLKKDLKQEGAAQQNSAAELAQRGAEGGRLVQR